MVMNSVFVTLRVSLFAFSQQLRFASSQSLLLVQDQRKYGREYVSVMNGLSENSLTH